MYHEALAGLLFLLKARNLRTLWMPNLHPRGPGGRFLDTPDRPEPRGPMRKRGIQNIERVLDWPDKSEAGLFPSVVVKTKEGKTAIFKTDSFDKNANPLYRSGKGHLYGPRTLPNREIAAYRISKALGLDVVPKTEPMRLLRRGQKPETGSVQDWVDGAETFAQQQYSHEALETARRYNLRFATQMKNIAILDAVLNSNDRHWGNLVVDKAGKMYAVDNGLSLSQSTNPNEFKSFPLNLMEGAIVPHETEDSLFNFITNKDKIREDLKDLLSEREINDVFTRAEIIYEEGKILGPDEMLGRMENMEREEDWANWHQETEQR